MISLTFLGNMKKLQDQVSLHVVQFYPFWLRVLCSILFVNAPDIQENQVSQRSGQMYSYNDCSSERSSYVEQKLPKNVSPLHLGGILGDNL